MYDVIVIGGGPGGYPCAIRCAQAGMKVGLVEAGDIGGLCLNRGCIPTKALSYISKDIGESTFKSVSKTAEFQWEKILEEIKTDVILRLRTGVSFLLKQNKIDLYQGEGKLAAPDAVKVGDKTIETKNIVIATGGYPLLPGIFKSENRVITSDDFWNLKTLPPSMGIVGGGVIGCEFASILNNFGVQVSIYEMTANLIPEGDEEITGLLKKQLEKKGVRIQTAQKIESIEEVKEEKVLVCIGRHPNIPQMANIDMSAGREGIPTNQYLKTGIENIYAVGDVRGQYLFAYTATKEGEVAACNIKGDKVSMDYSTVPSTIFTKPEISFCGITEKEAVEKGIDIKTGRFPYTALGKAYSQKQTEGLVKVIAKAETEEILGIHILGTGATELAAFSTLAIKNRMKVADLEQIIYCHPTYAEGIMEAVEDIKGKSIHLPPRNS